MQPLWTAVIGFGVIYGIGFTFGCIEYTLKNRKQLKEALKQQKEIFKQGRIIK
jgi:hypothetical protein